MFNYSGEQDFNSEEISENNLQINTSFGSSTNCLELEESKNIEQEGLQAQSANSRNFHVNIVY